jgi:hypothetical protein
VVKEDKVEERKMKNSKKKKKERREKENMKKRKKEKPLYFYAEACTVPISTYASLSSALDVHVLFHDPSLASSDTCRF